jgi:transcriptional regulator with XRE-family HTH domain
MEKSTALRLGANIKMFRKTKQLTQAALAEKIGIDPESISRFERGAVIPSLTTLEKIGIILDVGMADMFAGVSTHERAIHLRIGTILAELSKDDQLFLLDSMTNLADRLKQR